MKIPVLVRPILLIASALLLWGCSAESKREHVLERADKFYKSGDREKARIEYQNVLQGDPDNLVANERLALIWLDRGSPIRAARYLTKMRSVAPGILELRLKLAEIVLSVGNAAEAGREATAILERSSDFDKALVILTESVRTPDELKAADRILQNVADKSTVPYLIASAHLATLNGKPDGAKVLLQRAVARAPNSVEARVALATFLATQGTPDEAREEFKRATGLAPANSMVHLKYALFLAQNGDSAEAKTYLQTVVQKAPDYLPPLRALAELAIGEKKFDEAAARIQAVFVRDASDYGARILRARLWLAQGDTKRAIEDLQKVGAELPGLGIEKHQLALAYLQNNDHPAAIKALQETVARNPDNLDAQVMLAQLNLRAGAAQSAAIAMAELVGKRPGFAPAYPILIDALRNGGRLDQAAVLLERGTKASPRNPQLHFLLGIVRAQLQQPDEARQSFLATLAISPEYQAAEAELVALDLKAGETESAMQRAKGMVTKAPNSPAALMVEAKVHAARKEWAQGEALLYKALELEPNQIAAFGLLAQSFREQKNDPATPAKVDRLLEKYPQEIFATEVGAQFYLHIKNAGKARDIYEGFLTRKPGTAAVLNNLANLYADELKDLDRALEIARQARAADPASPAIADTLGWILYRKNVHPEALSLLRESAEKLRTVEEIQYHFGMVNLRLGNAEAARAALSVAVAGKADYAGRDEARRELAKLGGAKSL